MVNPSSKDQWMPKEMPRKKAVQKHWTDKLHREGPKNPHLRYFPSPDHTKASNASSVAGNIPQPECSEAYPCCGPNHGWTVPFPEWHE